MNLENKNVKSKEILREENIETELKKDELVAEEHIKDTLYVSKENKWRIEIPKINLIVNIEEGTTEDILNMYVGHFEETQKKDGNIGLAAHNRGYNVNYFNRLKELELGDEIIYTYDGISRTYIVNNLSIIEDTNWKVLENTIENQLTLITCVENRPSYRRCVQAICKKIK